MTDPSADLDQALTELDLAVARVHTADVRRDLTARPGLAYGPINQTHYLVTWNGQTPGELHHNPDDSWLHGWTAHANDSDEPLGTYRTPRLAAATPLRALLKGRP